MSMIVGIAGFSGSGKSLMANLFYEELKKRGLKTDFPHKYVVRSKRINDDPNTICVESESEIPVGCIKGRINNRRVFAYDQDEIQKMLDNNIWPIIQTANIDYQFDLKNKVSKRDPRYTKHSAMNAGILEKMKTYFAFAPFVPEEDFNLLSKERGHSLEDADKEVKKRLEEREWCMQQFLKHCSYFSSSKNSFTTRLGTTSGTMNIPIELLKKQVGDAIEELVDIDKLNKFILAQINAGQDDARDEKNKKRQLRCKK